MTKQHCGRCGDAKPIDPDSRHGFCHDCEAAHRYEKDREVERQLPRVRWDGKWHLRERRGTLAGRQVVATMSLGGSGSGFTARAYRVRVEVEGIGALGARSHGGGKRGAEEAVARLLRDLAEKITADRTRTAR